MVKSAETLTAQWKDVLSLLLGIWLIVSPFALGFTGEPYAAWTAYAFGVVIAVAAGFALAAFRVWEEWLNALFGLAVGISPWVLGYAALTPAMYNAAVVGVAVVVLTLWTATENEQRPGGMATKSSSNASSKSRA